MSDLLTGRVYVIIGLCVGALCFAVTYFDTSHAFANYLKSVGNDAARYGLGQTIAQFIIAPLMNVFSDPYWAIAAGVLWPLFALWFILFIFALGVSIFGPALSELGTVG